MRRVAFLLLVVALAGCGSDGPGAGETAASVGDSQMLTCGDDMVFAASMLATPPGAERGVGPQYEALRDGLALFAAEGGLVPTTGWRVVASNATRILFVADVPGAASPEWWSIGVELHDGRWEWAGGGTCNLRVVLGPGIRPAEWAPDPAFAAPGPAATSVHVLVWEMDCTSGQPATGRVTGPIVGYGADAVTITFGVRPLPAQNQTCPGNPPTPVVVELAEPLGDRELLDGGTFPAGPPDAP